MHRLTVLLAAAVFVAGTASTLLAQESSRPTLTITRFEGKLKSGNTADAGADLADAIATRVEESGCCRVMLRGFLPQAAPGQSPSLEAIREAAVAGRVRYVIAGRATTTRTVRRPAAPSIASTIGAAAARRPIVSGRGDTGTARAQPAASHFRASSARDRRHPRDAHHRRRKRSGAADRHRHSTSRCERRRHGRRLTRSLGRAHSRDCEPGTRASLAEWSFYENQINRVPDARSRAHRRPCSRAGRPAGVQADDRRGGVRYHANRMDAAARIRRNRRRPSDRSARVRRRVPHDRFVAGRAAWMTTSAVCPHRC